MKTRVIHQTWKTKDLPQEYAGFAESIRALHPGFDYRLWTDEDNRELIRTSYPWFLPVYDAYKHEIERVDAVRYFILYSYGGIYIDLDMECLKPLNDLLPDGKAYFSLEAGPAIQNQVVSNAFMASDPGNGFFHHIMTHLESFKTSDITFRDVFNNTGPDMVTRQYLQHRDRFEIGIIGLDEICPLKVLREHPRLRDHDLADIRRNRRLHLIHHNTESWNIQADPPERAPAGYELYLSHDIPGFDIDYVEHRDGDLRRIKAACDENPDAVGFNYNGYVKGVGGKLRRVESGGSWLKPGKIPWVCVKKTVSASSLS
ncbi:MAG: glycosyltransferase [Arenicellales bacterium]